ncbi:unnamed protein product [Alternaria alternata]
MSNINIVPFPDQNSTNHAREESQDWNDNHHIFPDVRHMKASRKEPRIKRWFHNLAQKYNSTDEQYDDERSPERNSYPSGTSNLVQERSLSLQSNNICDECRSLNLDTLIREIQGSNSYFVSAQYTAPWVWEKASELRATSRLRASVGFRYRRQQNACSLCRALAASRITPETSSSTGETEVKDIGDAILVTRYYPSHLLRVFRESNKVAVCLCLVPLGRDLGVRAYPDQHNSQRALVMLGSFDVPDLFDPQLFSPSFDSNLVMSWLNYCTQNHRLLCRFEPLPVHGVKVIDCTTLQIEDHNVNTPYVSLSYVWGKSKDACGPVETIRGKKTLPQRLSPVIRDSIQVTKTLGYRYLWIDKFCIDQDAAELKHDQIQQMDAIYKNSELTIIGAAGQDESYGLPGVGARGRRHQFVAKLDGATLFWDPIDPHEVISLSHWSTRGWTFQEALLSRRRLVFTEDQMYFQCNTMNCFESNHCALDKLHVKNRSKTIESVRAGIFGNSKHQNPGKLVRDEESLNESFGRYLSNVEDYTSRKLSFDEDSLNAFQGVIRQFSQEKYAINHVWGLAYPSDCKESLDLFVHSLTWMHRTKARRRNLFPSWTWAGWEGKIIYESCSGTKTGFVGGLHDLRFRTTTNKLLALEEMDEDRDHAILVITAKVVSLAPDAYHGSSPHSRRAARRSRPWSIAGHGARLWWSSSDQTDAELAEVFEETSRWQFVFVGRLLLTSFLMVLESCENGRTWRRAGMFVVDADITNFRSHGDQRVSTFEIE